MNTKMMGLNVFQKYCVLELWTKVASGLEGLIFRLPEFSAVGLAEGGRSVVPMLCCGCDVFC